MDRSDGMKNSRWPDRKPSSTTTRLWTYEVLLPQIGVVFLCREDLPSQLLREQRVVGGEELHHEAKDGVFRPWGWKKDKLWLRRERRDEGGGGWEDDVTYFKLQNHAMAISGETVQKVEIRDRICELLTSDLFQSRLQQIEPHLRRTRHNFIIVTVHWRDVLLKLICGTSFKRLCKSFNILNLWTCHIKLSSTLNT